MKKNLLFYLFTMGALLSCNDNPGQDKDLAQLENAPEANYLTTRAPLTQSAYIELPLGDIKPQGWLNDQLERMAAGMTGSLDEIYPEVVGSRNGWLGGDGDGWERGPYWISTDFCRWLISWMMKNLRQKSSHGSNGL